MAKNKIAIEALYKKGSNKIASKDYLGAIEVFDELISLEPHLAIAYAIKGFSLSSLGKILEDTGNHQESQANFYAAKISYELAIAKGLNFAHVYYNKGLQYFNSGQYKEAVAEYDKAIAMQPNYAPSYNNKGYALHNLGRYQEAIEMYDKAIALNPYDAFAYHNKAHALGAISNNYTTMIDLYDKAISLDAYNPSYHNSKSLQLFNSQKYQEALVECDKAISLDPNYISASHNKAGILWQLTKNEALVRAQCERTYALNPKDTSHKWSEYFKKPPGACRITMHNHKEALLNFNDLLSETLELFEVHKEQAEAEAVKIANERSLAATREKEIEAERLLEARAKFEADKSLAAALKQQELQAELAEEARKEALRIEGSLNEDITTIFSRISEGELRIRDQEENAMLIMGKTGVGKSTLACMLSRQGLNAQYGDEGWKIDVTGDTLEGGVVLGAQVPQIRKNIFFSETKIPNKCKVSEAVIWDCPGFDDAAGVVQDIANSFYIKKLFDNTNNIKFLLAVTHYSITHNQGREFIEIISHFARMFANIDNIKNSLAVVVTQADAPVEVGSVHRLLKKLVGEHPDINKPENAATKQVIESLTEKSIHIFHKPKTNGELGLEITLESFDNLHYFKPNLEAHDQLQQQAKEVAANIAQASKVEPSSAASKASDLEAKEDMRADNAASSDAASVSPDPSSASISTAPISAASSPAAPFDFLRSGSQVALLAKHKGTVEALLAQTNRNIDKISSVVTSFFKGELSLTRPSMVIDLTAESDLSLSSSSAAAAASSSAESSQQALPAPDAVEPYVLFGAPSPASLPLALPLASASSPAYALAPSSSPVPSSSELSSPASSPARNNPHETLLKNDGYDNQFSANYDSFVEPLLPESMRKGSDELFEHIDGANVRYFVKLAQLSGLYDKLKDGSQDLNHDLEALTKVLQILRSSSAYVNPDNGNNSMGLNVITADTEEVPPQQGVNAPVSIGSVNIGSSDSGLECKSNEEAVTVYEPTPERMSLGKQIGGYIHILKQQVAYKGFFEDLCKIAESDNLLKATVETCKTLVAEIFNDTVHAIDIQRDIEVLRIAPDNIEYFQQVKVWLDKWSEVFPDQEDQFIKTTKAQNFYAIGSIHENRHENNLAIENYNEALKQNPKLVPVYTKLGDLFFNHNHEREAIKYYDAVNRSDMVEKCFERLIEKNPQNPDIYTAKGNYFIKLAMPEIALGCFHKALGFTQDQQKQQDLCHKIATAPQAQAQSLAHYAQKAQTGEFYDWLTPDQLQQDAQVYLGGEDVTHS